MAETEDYYQMPPLIRESTYISQAPKLVESPSTKSVEKMPPIVPKAEERKETPQVAFEVKADHLAVKASIIGTLDYQKKAHSTSSLNETGKTYTSEKRFS